MESGDEKILPGISFDDEAANLHPANPPPSGTLGQSSGDSQASSYNWAQSIPPQVMGEVGCEIPVTQQSNNTTCSHQIFNNPHSQCLVNNCHHHYCYTQQQSYTLAYRPPPLNVGQTFSEATPTTGYNKVGGNCCNDLLKNYKHLQGILLQTQTDLKLETEKLQYFKTRYTQVAAQNVCFQTELSNMQDEQSEYESLINQINNDLSIIYDKITVARGLNKAGDTGTDNPDGAHNSKRERNTHSPEIVLIDATIIKNEFEKAMKAIQRIYRTLHSELSEPHDSSDGGDDESVTEPDSILNTSSNNSPVSGPGESSSMPEEDGNESYPVIVGFYETKSNISVGSSGASATLAASPRCLPNASVPSTRLQGQSGHHSISQWCTPERSDPHPREPRKRKKTESIVSTPEPSPSSLYRTSGEPSPNTAPVRSPTKRPIAHRHSQDLTREPEDGLFWCSCGSKYASKGSLQMHIKSQNKGYVCGSCNEQFMNFGKLQVHMQIAHNLIVRTISSDFDKD